MLQNDVEALFNVKIEIVISLWPFASVRAARCWHPFHCGPIPFNDLSLYWFRGSVKSIFIVDCVCVCVCVCPFEFNFERVRNPACQTFFVYISIHFRFTCHLFCLFVKALFGLNIHLCMAVPCAHNNAPADEWILSILKQFIPSEPSLCSARIWKWK